MWYDKLRIKRGKTQQPTSFGDLLLFLPLIEEDCLEKIVKQLNDAEKPDWLFGKDTLENFNLITFGQYSDLCDALEGENHIEVIKNIIHTMYDVTDEDIDNESAYDIWGYVNFAVAEIQRINKLFGSIKMEYTEQEKKAGIERLQFGTFGILDWYSKRMGIVDQNLVNNEKWVRIFQCMKNDNDEALYNRRLQKVYEAEAKQRSKH